MQKMWGRKMICPKCQGLNQRSTVTPGLSTSTCCMYEPFYYDEDGNMIRNKDPNIHGTEYRCSNGHRFHVSRIEGEKNQIRVYE